MKIISVDPLWFHKGESNNYLSARFFFTKNYVDALFFSSKTNFNIWILNCLRSFTNIYSILSKKKIVFNYSTLNSEYDVAIIQGNPILDYLKAFKGVKILKIASLFDYNYYPINLSNELKIYNVNTVIGHTRHDVFDPFFSKIFQTNNFNHVIDYPFGFNDKSDFDAEKKSTKIVGLGAISKFNRPRQHELKEYYSYMKNIKRNYSHLDRQWFRDNSLKINEIFQNYFPDDKTRRNNDFEEKDVLPKYSFFLNDLGSLNFLPARFFEGIGNGVIPFAINHPIYKHYGFDESNMVFYSDYEIDEIRFKHQKAMENIFDLKKQLKKSKDLFSYESINKKLLKDINDVVN